MTSIISRKEAKALGLKHYFTGKPCKRGHISGRRVDRAYCTSCHNIIKKRNRSTKRGFLTNTHSSIRRRCEGRCSGKGSTYKNKHYAGFKFMPKQEFLDWALNDRAFNKLWDEWIESGKSTKLTPSIDRIDTLRGYVAGNVQYITMSANSFKANLWKTYGVNPNTSTRVATKEDLKHAA